MIKVTRFCHAGDRHNQQISFCFTHCIQCHFKLRPVNGMPCLKTNNAFPPQLFIHVSYFSWSLTQLLKIEMQRKADNFQLASYIIISGHIEQIINSRMIRIICSIYGFCFLLPVNRPNIFNMQNCQKKTLWVTKSYGLSGFEASSKRFINVQTYGNGPKQIILKTHSIQNRRVVRTIHISCKGAESPGGKKF